MKILAYEIENPDAAAEEFLPLLEPEARRVWELYQQNFIREIYFRQDTHTAVMILECDSLEIAEEILSAFPLVQAGLISFALFELAPYTGFERLFAKP